MLWPNLSAGSTRGSSPSWDVKADHNCDNDDTASKIGFLHQTNLTGCEQACSANPACREFNLKLADPFWCALYNTSSTPRSAAGYTCGCKGQCNSAPAPPGPGPSPPPPPPPPPPRGPMRGVVDAYYYGWAQYYLMLLDAGKGPFETVGHAQSVRQFGQYFGAIAHTCLSSMPPHARRGLCSALLGAHACKLPRC